MQIRKAIALMSGGLDSTLAAKIVMDQGIEVTGLHLLSPFGCRADVEKNAKAIGIPLLFKEKGSAYLDLVARPRYGYGSAMNPCIDCRIFMFQLADVVRQDLGADFIITGEVVGQRPMSQRREAMDTIDRNSPIEGLVLRPLSAGALAPTIPETEGWVDREKLYRVTGRGRKEQLLLAEKFGISEYTPPGGGCLLTETGFAPKLKDFFSYPTYRNESERLVQSQLLRYGRHFRISPETKIILGRNADENSELETIWVKAGGSFLNPENFDGPAAVVLGECSESVRTLAGEMVAGYGKSMGVNPPRVTFRDQTGEKILPVLNTRTQEELRGYRL